MKKKFNFNTLVMIYAIVIAVAFMTWFIPGGEYKREIKEDRNIALNQPLYLKLHLTIGQL